MDRNALIRALRDTAQSASNTIASNISGPVDLIAAGLRGVGLPIPQNPVGGSQWMAERGLTAPVQQGAAQVVGDTLGMVGPVVAMKYAPQIANVINRGAQNLAAPTTLNRETGAIVWHGSPHKFDKFDSSKIGTGEGAQAYGHGLYLAESPDVAGSYSRLGEIVSIDGVKVSSGGSSAAKEAAKKLGISDAGINYLGLNNWDVSKAAASLSDDIKNASTIGDRAFYNQIAGDLKRLRKSNVNVDAGQLYKIDLPDDQIAKMLDWDKPLSQQAPEVQSVIRNIAPTAKPYDIPIDHDPTGAQFYGMLSAPTEVGQAGASQMFREMGIPGIRYLDGGSRAGGQGTSNFVVFPGNENILQILERNGQPLGLMGVR